MAGFTLDGSGATGTDISNPQLRAPTQDPESQPGFAQWFARNLPSTLGYPVDASATMLRSMGVPMNLESVPFGTAWWQNAINNPSVTWDQVQAAIQSPSMHSMRGIGGLF